jgi:hypothetical protein
MNIYHTDLSTLDEGLENQLMLEAQIKYAIATDHTHIIDCNDMLFEISIDGNEISITEVDTDGDECTDCIDCDDDSDELTTAEIIDLIIRNSLLSSEPIRKEQADTMLVLAQLKHVLAAS